MTQNNDYTGTTPGTTASATDVGTGPTTNVGIFAPAINARDRLHWGAVWGGLFAALATLFLLGVLGTAVGLSAYDPGNAGEVATGVGIWMIISAIIAFFIGGWLAGRSAAVAGSGNGLLNGAMVWALALGLLLLLSGTTLTNLIGVNLSPGASGGTGGGGGVANLSNASSQIDLDRAQTAGAVLGGQQGGGTEAGGTATGTQTESAADNAASAAWWTLAALLLGLACAALGGWVGVSKYDRDRDDHDRNRGDYANRPATA